MPDYRGLAITPLSFGTVSTDDLFCEKEQALFTFYADNKERYKHALDIGANVGVHTCLMLRQGWEVRAFEPDPLHFNALVDNLIQNGLIDDENLLEVARQAVSDKNGRAEFVRVLNNTTGNHLEGDKTPYGPLARITVGLRDCRPLFKWADFAKIDCEGHEAKLLCSVTDEPCHFMVEVGNPKNAHAIYEHFKGKRKMTAQRLGWNEVKTYDDMPTHHSDGALFVGAR